jgi:AraC-like DNA-binding protein
MNDSMELEFNEINYTAFVQYLSLRFGVPITKGKMSIPALFGQGFFYAQNFGSGMSCMISQKKMKEDFSIIKSADTNTQYFILLFSESQDETPSKQIHEQIDPFNVGQPLVRLTNSTMRTISRLPAHVESRVVSILFNKQFLLQYLGPEEADNFLSIYYGSYIKTPYMAPVTAEFRALLSDIHQETWQHPFSNFFLENRLLLLMENFLFQFLKLSQSIRKLSFNDEEVTRLVRAEANLVKNFGIPAPTIDYLSRLCAMSATKFKNDFKSLYGLPVYEYYQKNRMMYARSLLIQQDYNIKEVGRMCGYANLGHFAAAFKKEFGMLPSEMATSVNNI